MNKEESDLIIAEQNKSTEEILKAVVKFKSDYHELCKLKDMRIEQLEKDVKLLGERCNQLLADKGKLTDENAELKKELDEIDKAGEHVRQQINDAFRNKKPYWELEKENTQLKEAKVIIKKIEKIFYSGENALKRLSKISDILAEAEQFLNSEVEK